MIPKILEKLQYYGILQCILGAIYETCDLGACRYLDFFGYFIRTSGKHEYFKMDFEHHPFVHHAAYRR